MTASRLHRFTFVIALLAGCGQTDETITTLEPAGGSVTLWTAQSELFMEYPALVVGNETRFAVHLTWLSDFTPVTEGSLSLRGQSSSGVLVQSTAQAPTSPGIYRPTITFEQPGIYRLTLIIDGRAMDTMLVEGLNVYASIADVPSEPDSPAEEQRIVFLKEQQWKTDFMTTPVDRKRITGTVRAACEIVPKMSNQAVVSAPFTGIVAVNGNHTLPSIGQRVHDGEILAIMTPSAETAGGIENFSSRYIEAKSDLDLAGKEFERARRMYAGDLISEKEYQEAEAEFKEADATYRTLSTFAQSNSEDLSFTAFAIRAPLSGTIADAGVVPGRQLQAGEELYHIIDASTVWVEADVASTDIGRLTRPNRAWFQMAGDNAVFEVNSGNGKLISVATAIDPMTRTFPVIFEVQNADGRLRIGMFGEISIAIGSGKESLIVPESALIEEEGRYSVYVQLEGEAFAKRDVILGERNGRDVEILKGVFEGEHVVTLGAYQVRLASLSSQLPEHGHDH